MFAQGQFSNLSREYILSQTSEEKILKYYLNVTKIPCAINSPFREDNHPSLGLYYSTNGIAYKDFKTSDRGGLLTLLMKLFNLDYYQLLEKIRLDLPNIGYIEKHTFIPYKYNKTQTKFNKVTTSDLKVKVREFRDYDYIFWEEFGINKDWLNFGDIYAISQIFITKDGKQHIISADKYAYCFVEFKDGKESLKIYQPFSTYFKWINNHNSSVWDLWGKLPPYGDKLIITSSRKDALCLWANIGIPCTSLQGEGYIPKPHVVLDLIKRFPLIYAFYDNDYDKEINYGKEFSDKLCELFNFKQLLIPSKYEAKDPSDLYRKYGKEQFKKIINILLK